MAASAIDKWLRVIDEFSDLSEAEVDEHIRDLRNEIERAETKIGVLMALKRALRTPPPRPLRLDFEDADRPIAVEELAPSADEKRQAIIETMQAYPDRTWSPRALRDALEQRGLITNADEGTPTRLLLRRMVQQGTVQLAGKGAYVLRDKPAQVTVG